ncbi:MAG: hypothetical protein IPJ82_00200 [Lewinellaceae bacterium]|nr:hypothetical protein [Lewinellaceae bacterium]
MTAFVNLNWVACQIAEFDYFAFAPFIEQLGYPAVAEDVFHQFPLARFFEQLLNFFHLKFFQVKILPKVAAVDVQFAGQHSKENQEVAAVLLGSLLRRQKNVALAAQLQVEAEGGFEKVAVKSASFFHDRVVRVGVEDELPVGEALTMSRCSGG